jgi:phosphoglycolate phosphatase-like HAD superfamily hydrolase
VADLNIDLSQSWFVGDTTTDVQTAKNAGLKSILLQTGHGGKDAKHTAQPDFIAENLLEAVKLILSR